MIKLQSMPWFILGVNFLKIYFRDKQSLFFGLLFPVILMATLGYLGDDAAAKTFVGVVDKAQNAQSAKLIAKIQEDEFLEVRTGSEAELKALLESRRISAIVEIPATFTDIESQHDVRVFIDSAQLGDAYDAALKIMERSAHIEQKLRGLSPILNLTVEDIQQTNLSYIDFLLPGILAFSIMQIAVAGSGFNIVEYRRKGILKRLFVTPIRPSDVILAMVFARLSIILIQITLIVTIGVVFLGAVVQGSLLWLYLVSILGCVIFLCAGFFLGSRAKTQQAIQGMGNIVVFPQMLLSGIFYPVAALPDFLQPLAKALPLTFLADALRHLATFGTPLLEIWPSLLGLFIWLVLAFFAASKYFVWRDVAA